MKYFVTFEEIDWSNVLAMKKSPSSARHCPAWYVQVAEEMARNEVSLKEAAITLEIELDPDEIGRIERRREFQEILRIEKNKFYAMVANDPSRSKSTALGIMWVLAEKLTREGQHEKAAMVLEKIAKVEGWTGADSNINVFAGLTARDIAEARDRLTGENSRGNSNPIHASGEGMPSKGNC